MHDVARQAGVGIGTVSSVLNNSRPVSQATREKVLAAIDKLEVT
ncbi:LacI family DNA-binding transcriptional regulator [Anaerolineales bacterium HSG24]|nr:LacI family DNA-binding transcriptional regulator [Anaerolineales bacterium HSG24]